MDEATIRENYLRVVERIANAAQSAGRSPDSIRLVVVTKTQPIEFIQAVIDAGAHHLGENYVEDAIPKIAHFTETSNLNWHMIGHIQGRKAAAVCDNFQYVHSIDSIKLAEKMNRLLLDRQKIMPVWLECNVSSEESKSGWDTSDEKKWSDIIPEVEKILTLNQLRVVGVMTIPPFSIDPEASRPYYRRLRLFQDYLGNHFPMTNFYDLSIGMSGDFDVAIQEGSTCVRIGQAIFGPRV